MRGAYRSISAISSGFVYVVLELGKCSLCYQHHKSDKTTEWVLIVFENGILQYCKILFIAAEKDG